MQATLLRPAGRGRLVLSSVGPITPAVAALLLALAVLATGCSRLISTTGAELADHLARAVAAYDDPAMVRDGAPAHLLALEGLLQADPHNQDLLRHAANLYATYATAFVTDTARTRTLTQRALTYGLQAFAQRYPQTGDLRTMHIKELQRLLDRTVKTDVPVMYALAEAWASWIQARRDEWGAIADIARAEALLTRVAALQETYQDGAAHLYLGIFATLRSPTLGGQPEVGRAHFERARELSGGRNLMVPVAYARHYARITFDRELHDRLLKAVVEADPRVDGYTLVNILAQEEARRLLDGADDYF